MGTLVLLRNPLTPHEREVYPVADGMLVIDWLQKNHPEGFGMPVRFYMNGAEKPLDDLDTPVGRDDVAIIALMPGDPGTITLSAFLVQLAIGIILAGASLALNYFFQPKEQSGSKGVKGSTSVYDVSGGQNTARLGEPIPVIYGTVMTTPDYVAQPYTFYRWGQNLASMGPAFNGIQYLNLLLCLGQGNISVSDVYFADTNAKTPDAGIVYWKVFTPADHKSTMGTIATAVGADGFHENVITSPEVSNQEFSAANDTAGYFATCKPGKKGKTIEIDIVFPGGQWFPQTSGEVSGRITDFNVLYQELSDDDVPIGTVTTVPIRASSADKATYTTAYVPTNATSGLLTTNQSAISSPLRRTYRITTPRSARWAVKVVRVSPAVNVKSGTDRFVWTGLRLFADYPTTSVYGNVTLMVVQVKSSQGLGNDAAIRIGVKATRRLALPNSTTETQTTSGAHAFFDVYTNTTYGAARPASEVDTTTITALNTKWGTYQFNYVFSDRITVWEALRTITTPFGAEPLPIGPVMSIVQDGVKPVRAMLFTDANIIADSMSVNYSWDEENATDGVEIEYLDPKDFRPVYARFPSTSLRPDQYALPGVTNAAHAAQYAQLTWQRRQLQRKRITFDTELEGLILQLGDRIGVAHNVPKWGDSGLIIARSNSTLTVDHNLDWTGGAKQILLRNQDGSVTGPINVIRGTADNKMVMQSPGVVTVNYDNDYEYTSFAFGTSTTLVRDFIVTATTPTSDNTVTVDAVNYDPNIFTNTMSFML